MAETPRPIDTALESGNISSDASSNRDEKQIDSVGVAVEVVETGAEEDVPPDGGLTAWLQVVGSHFLYFNTWGTINMFGVFQTYYEKELLRDMSPSAISWIGSLQSFLLLAVGVVSGPLYDAGHLRLLLCAGWALVPLGMMLISVCSAYWQVMLAQAVCVGVGTGCLYVPSVAVIPQYFARRRALAMGLVSSGSSLGGVVYALMFQGLLPRLGFAWAARVMGFTSFATIAVPVLVLRRRAPAPPGAAVRSLLDVQAFRERPYVIYCLGISLSYVAFFVPIFYLQGYALAHGLAGQTVALYLVAVLNAASVLGRLSPSLVANRIGPVQTLLVSVTMAGVTAFAWINTGTAGGNIAFAVFFGFFTGGIVALPAVVLTSFTPDLSRLGTRLGMSSMLNGVASLVGSPIAGAILNGTGSYLGIQLFAGFLFLATSIFLVTLRFVLTGKKLVAKA
ncbi:putative MFS monocarboxylate transporter [Hypoxylon sp. FL1284]|nr:putative MFS monocarboxylate transporter [Hypoxylon sp. FL1284]